MNFAKTPDLPDDQKFALMKFRRQISDIMNPDYDDHYLLRWLRARQWNVANAEKMLRDAIKTQNKWGVADIESWQAPVVFKDHIAHGCTGFDKDGSPIIIVPFSGIDMWGLLHSSTKSDFIRNLIQLLEKFMKIALEQSKIHGPEARKFVVIFDMDNFNMKQYAWRPAAELVIQIIQMYSNNYPEILKYCCIINAPKIFSFAFNIVKKFLDEYTLSKIHIFKCNKNKWLPAILERMDSSNFPAYYGGTLTDADGNPKCLEKIIWGGKVPKEFYISKEDTFNSNSSYQTVVIKKGSKLKLEFDIKQSGIILKWDFKTHSHDIRFGIRSENTETGEKINEIPLMRISSQESEEIGFLACNSKCKYTVVFDNSYSFFKNKKLTYSVVTTTSTDKLDQNADKVEETLECEDGALEE
ncbi:unnamed protein product [Diamesa tonsa]